jgi:DsbC/DsbD-like thiol-disulfide interchange protein
MRIIAATGIVLFLFVPPTGNGQPQGKEHVSVSAKLSQDGVQGGGELRGALIMTVAGGWHVNSATPADENLIGTAASFSPPAGLSVVQVQYPGGTSKKFAFSEEPVSVYEGTVVILFKITALPSTSPGDYALPVDVSYQACNNDICLPPAAIRAVITVRVLSSGAVPVHVNDELFNGDSDK